MQKVSDGDKNTDVKISNLKVVIISHEHFVEKFKQLGIKKVAPSHCTGKNATKIFRKAYGGDFLEVRVGQIIEI